MIRLPYSLGKQARKEIENYKQAHNIISPSESRDVYNPNEIFLETELKYVKSLTYTGEPIDFKLFISLESLTFDRNPQVDNRVISEVLLNFPNLKELYIRNQRELTRLDLSRFRNLKVLEIISNKKLYIVDRIPDTLSSLVFYDNPLYRHSEKLCEYVINHINSGMNANLDVLYYIDMQSLLNKKDFKEKEDIEDILSLYVKWSEKITEERILGIDSKREFEKNDKGIVLTYKTAEFDMAHKKALKIISSYISPLDTDEEKFAILYQWMVKNIKCGNEGKDNNTAFHEPSTSKLKIKTGQNDGTYSGLTFKKCVGQGYTRIMMYMLKMLGISSFEILCNVSSSSEITKYERKITIDHPIIKVNIGGKIDYCDLIRDASEFQERNNRMFQYFMLSVEDISKYHKLIDEEGFFSADSLPFPKKAKLMGFAADRIGQVNSRGNNQFYQNEDYRTR